MHLTVPDPENAVIEKVSWKNHSLLDNVGTYVNTETQYRNDLIA